MKIRNDLEHKTEPKNEQGWEILGEEVLNNLREVMKSFSFLQHYDLIRIVDPKGEEHKYDQYTGQVITHHQKRLESEQNIESGWFYISRQDGSLLGLHPLLIFWTSSDEGNWIEGKELEEQDVAVFDRLMKGAAGYIATVMRDVFEKHDTQLMSQLRDLIYYNLEHVKMARQQVKLSWEAVREAIHEVSREQMETAQKKYNALLYLQRDGILEIPGFPGFRQGLFCIDREVRSGQEQLYPVAGWHLYRESTGERPDVQRCPTGSFAWRADCKDQPGSRQIDPGTGTNPDRPLRRDR